MPSISLDRTAKMGTYDVYKMSAMQKRVIQILSKRGNHRYKQEIDEILPWLRRKYATLASMDSEILRKLLTQCSCEKVKCDDVIIQQGHIGQNYYIVLAGTVSVYVDTRHIELEDSIHSLNHDNTTTNQQSNLSTARSMSLESGDGDNNTSNDKNKAHVLDRSIFGKFMVKIAEGHGFGEVALIREDNIRTATVIAEDVGYLLVINRELFDQTLKNFQEKEYECRRKLINNHPLFKNWTPKNKKSLELSLWRKTYSFDSVIAHQGQKWAGIMLITDGIAKVQVEPAKHNIQYKDHLPFTEHEDVYEMELNRALRKPPRTSSEERLLSSRAEKEQVYVRRKEGYAAAEKRIQKRCIDLCSIENGDVIGDIEAIMNLNTYTCTVKAATKVETYIITPKNYERLLSKDGPEVETFECLQKQVVTKLKTRIDTVQGENIPFFKHILNKISIGDRKPYIRPVIQVKNFSSLPKEEELFENLLSNYMVDKAQLVTPRVAGGDYYKTLFRANVLKRESSMVENSIDSLHRVQKTKKVKVRRPSSVKPRTATALKKALKDGRDIVINEDKRRYIEDYRQKEEKDIEMAKLHFERLRTQIMVKEDNLIANSMGENNMKKQEESTNKATVTNINNDHDKVLNKKRPQSTFITKLFEDGTNEAKSRPDSAMPLPKSETNCVKDVLQSVEQVERDKTLVKFAKKPAVLKRQLSCNLPDINGLPSNDHGERPFTTRYTRVASKSCDNLTDSLTPKTTPRLHPREMTFHKNDKEIERLVLPILSDNPKYRDCATNDTSLAYLEAKVKDFIMRQEKKDAIGELPRLHRFEIKDEMAKQPARGGKVIIKTNPCPISSKNNIARSSHQHVRCQLLPKIPEYDKFQRQRLIRQHSQQEEMSHWLEEERKRQQAAKLARRNSSTFI